jgi:hypothetical protein
MLYLIYTVVLNINIYFKDKKRKELHATQWCQTLAEGITKFNQFEKVEIKSQYMTELIGKYIQGLETWKDPWGNRYKLNYKKGIVYSSGPNGIDYDYDDIIVKYK